MHLNRTRIDELTFECTALGFGNEEGSEQTSQHEEGKDLKNVLDKLARSADILEASKADLRNDCAELSRGSSDTVGSRAVASRKGLAGNDEGRSVGTEILEEVCHAGWPGSASC